MSRAATLLNFKSRNTRTRIRLSKLIVNERLRKFTSKLKKTSRIKKEVIKFDIIVVL